MRRHPFLRRLTAVVMQLLLLQLTVASAAGACPLGEHGTHHDGMHMSGGPSSDDQHHPVDANLEPAHQLTSPASHHAGGGHCDMSCATASCAAAGHCITSATLASGDADHAPELEQSGASARADAVPHSVSSAPEPPPPRA